MLKKILILSVKRHPLAVALYMIYICIWLWMCYLTYYFLIQGDADVIQGILFYWCMCLCIPYLIVNIILSYQSLKFRRFYNNMSNLIFVPIGILILVWIEHGMIAYFNKGV